MMAYMGRKRRQFSLIAFIMSFQYFKKELLRPKKCQESKIHCNRYLVHSYSYLHILFLSWD